MIVAVYIETDSAEELDSYLETALTEYAYVVDNPCLGDIQSVCKELGLEMSV